MLGASTLVDTGCRRPFGHSRKSLLQFFNESEAAQRDDLTLALSAQFTGAGVHSLRVHVVSQHVGLLQQLCAGCASVADQDVWPSFEENRMAQWRKSAPDEVYTAEEVLARLSAELPKWTFEDGWIRRKIKTSGWKSTLMVVNAVGHLAEAAWHHPDMTLSYAFVNIKLMNHAAKGITDKDFALAAKIEEVLMWRPGAEPGSALEGTPDDPRFKYLKYD